MWTVEKWSDQDTKFPCRIRTAQTKYGANCLEIKSIQDEHKNKKCNWNSVLTSSTKRKSIRQFSGTKWNLHRSTFFRRCFVTMALGYQFSRATTAAGIVAAVRCNSRCTTTDKNNSNGVCSKSVAWLLLLLLRPFGCDEKFIYRLFHSIAKIAIL